MKLSRYTFSLLEDKREQIIQWIRKRNPSLSGEEANQIIDESNEIDPTGRIGAYTFWIVKQLIYKNINFPEDKEKVKKTLELFQNAIRSSESIIPKDINQYRSYGELAQTLKPFEKGEQPLSKKEITRNLADIGTKEIYNDGKIQIIEISTPEAAAKWCKGTEWCTKDPRFAKSYLQVEPLHLLIENGERKYLIGDKGSGREMRDIYDTFIDIEEYQKYMNILKKVKISISSYDEFLSMSPEERKKDISSYIIKVLVNTFLSFTKEVLNTAIIIPLLNYWNKKYRYYSIIDLPPIPDLYNICDIEKYIPYQENLVYEYIESRNLPYEKVEDIISGIVEEIQEEVISTFLDVVEKELEKKTRDISKDCQKLYEEVIKKEGYDSIEEAPEDLLFDIDEQLSYKYSDKLDFTDEEVARIQTEFRKLIKEKYKFV